MQQTLPLDSYSWHETITLAEVLNTNDDFPIRYFVELDLDYRLELHDSHNDLPLEPEKFSIQQSGISPSVENFGVKIAPEAPKKLIWTLSDKQNYVCHYRSMDSKSTNFTVFCNSGRANGLVNKKTVMGKQASNDFENKF